MTYQTPVDKIATISGDNGFCTCQATCFVQYGILKVLETRPQKLSGARGLCGVIPNRAALTHERPGVTER